MIRKQASAHGLTSDAVDTEEVNSLQAAKARIDAALAMKGKLDGPTLIEDLKVHGYSRAAGSRAIAFYVSRGEYKLGYDNVLTKPELA